MESKTPGSVGRRNHTQRVSKSAASKFRNPNRTNKARAAINQEDMKVNASGMALGRSDFK